MDTYTPKLFDVLKVDTGTGTRRYHVLKLWTLSDGDIVVTLNTRKNGKGYGGSVALSELRHNIVEIEGERY